MPLVWDNTGALVPPGKVEKTLDENFMLGVLPSWLTIGNGTSSFGATTNSRGYLQVATAATVGSSAQVKTSFTMDLSNVRAIRWEAFGLVYDGDVTQIAMGCAGAGSTGGYLREDYSAGDSSVHTNVAGIIANHDYDIKNGGEYQRRRNLALWLLPPTSELYIMEDDQVMAYRNTTTMNIGAVSSDVSLTTREAVAHNFQVSRLRYTVWHD